MEVETEEKYFLEGYRAYSDGIYWADNPYPTYGELPSPCPADIWEDGWMAAKRDDKIKAN